MKWRSVLVGSTEGELNYQAGQTAVVRLDPEHRFPTYQIVTPRDRFRQAADPTRNSIVVSATETPGNYRITAGGSGDRGFDRGFSVNLPIEASQLERDQESEI